MPDKKYLIEIPDMPDGSGVWDADKWERNKDKFMQKYPTANVFELGSYDPEDMDDNDQFMLTFDDDPDASGVWDAAKWERNKDKFLAKYPEARVNRVRYMDYWGDKAKSDQARIAELQQPDEERNARLAEMGYYDDSAGTRVDYAKALGLSPLSSAVKTNSVSGEVTYLDPKVEEFFANDTEYTDRQMELNRLRDEYEANPRVIEQREYEAQMARYAEELEKQIKADMEADVDAYHAGRGAAAKHMQDASGANQTIQAIRMLKGEDVGKDVTENEKQERYASALKLLQQAKDARNVAGKGMAGGVADTAKDWLRNLGTQSDIEMYNEVGNILTALEQKVGNLNEVSDEVIEENLTNDEKALIRAFFEYNAAMADAGEDMSIWYKGGKIFAESIPFMMEFLVTGGLANSAGRAATSWMGKGFAKWIANSAKGTAARAAKKVTAKTVSGVAKTIVAAGARTLVAPTTYKNIAEQSVQYGEDGHLDRDGNMVKAAVDSYIEQLSEMSGAAFGEVLGGVGRLALGKTAFEKVGAWFGNNAVMQNLSKLGFHGLPEEVGEEIFGNALRTITGVDKEALSRMFEKDEFASMIIGFAPMTLLGAGMSMAKMGAVSIGATNAGRRMRQDLSRSYTEEQIDQVEMALDEAKDANEIANAIRPIIMGMQAAGAPLHEVQSVWDYAIAVAKRKAMVSAQSTQEMQLAQAKIDEAQERMGGRFWIENKDGVKSVKQVVLNNGNTAYVVSEPDQDGRVAIINAVTGQKGTALPGDIKEESWNGTLNAFGTGLVMADRTQREQQRMQEERTAQVNEVRNRLGADPRINVGTEGSPIYVVAQSFNDAGVRYVAQDGSVGNMSWEQAADSIGMPIVVKTDAQIAQEEAEALVAAAAERRAKRAKKDAVGATERDNAVVDAENAVEGANEAAKHIPMNDDGTVNEAAFWEQSPEEYVKWNDEQNQDGGQDSLEQVAIAKQELMGLLQEANAAQNTSNPTTRKAAKKEVERLADRIARLDAIEQSYAQALEEEQAAVRQTAAAPTSSMSEEDLESMDAQYQGILGKTRVQGERVRVMQEYLDKLAEGSVPVVLLTRQNYEEKLKKGGLPSFIINKVKQQVDAGKPVAGFMARGKVYLMEDGLSSIEEARVTYVHERQHTFNSSNPQLVQRVANALGNEESALAILKSFVKGKGIDSYKDDDLNALADEIICRSMEIAYTTEVFSVDLQSRGIPSEVISIIAEIDNEQRQDQSLSHARRRSRRNSHADVSGAGSVREDGRDFRQVSEGVLEQEETRPSGASGRGTQIGERGEGAEVISEEQLLVESGLIESQDIRFRITPEQDKAYMDAVEAGDMETAQRMVVEAARLAMPNTKVVDENGNPMVVYHGTLAKKLTRFNKDLIGSRYSYDEKGFFFISRESIAKDYATPDFGTGSGTIIPAFINLENPLFVNQKWATKNGLGNRVFKDNDVIEFWDNYQTLMIEESEDKDGVIISDGTDIMVVAFEPSQIKSAEPVTYDNDGNVIPLSERFNKENPDIRFRVRSEEEREKLFEDAKKHYGVTQNFKVAGYMLPDGSLLDFSEANDGGDPNSRSLDHRDIEGVIMDNGVEYDSRWMYIADFMNEGAIRLLPESAGINMIQAPTEEQRKKIFDFIYKYNGEVILEINDERLNSVAYMEYDRRTSPSRIFRDIDGYFNNGIVPQQDIRFRMSNNNQAIFVSNAARAVEGIKQEKATPEQWLKMLEKAGGLKAGEDKWLGLSDWLNASDKKTLTKQEVLDFINENMIIIEEQHYSEDENALDGKRQEIQEALQGIFDEYVAESEDMNDDMFMKTHYDYAIQKLADELGYTAFNAPFVNNNAVVELDFYEDDLDTLHELSNRLGLEKYDGTRDINDTRLYYTTEGLTDRHEIALTVPTIEPWNERDDVHFGDAGDGRAIAWIRFGETEVPVQDAAYTRLQEIYDRLSELEMKVSSTGISHEEYEERARLREERNELQEIETRNHKVLVIDEIQSKRHQDARELGYRTNLEKAKADMGAFLERMHEKYEFDLSTPFADVFNDEDLNEYYILDRARNNAYLNKGIPDAPFDKNWHELAMKRMLRYAAENGYDVIAWTTGDQQASRYDLSKMVKKISVYPSKDGSRIVDLHLVDRENDFKNLVVDSEGMVTFGEYKGRALADVVGKDYSMKIMAAARNTEFSGDNLQVGGEGMKGFYDKMLPAFMNKYGKKWGVKVEDIDLPNLGRYGYTMHSVPVTEEMKASVMEGQVMFRVRGENESAEEFVNGVIEDFKSRYTAFNDIVALDPTSKEQLADFIGMPVDKLSDEMMSDLMNRIEERDSRAWFNPDTKRIAIFVRENVRDGKKSELVLIHENIHAINKKHNELIAIGEYLWNSAKEGTREYRYKTAITEAYPESEWFDEMSAYVVSEYIQDGEIDVLKGLLDAESTELLDKLLKYNGNGKERARQRPRISWNVLRERPSDKSEESRDEGGEGQSGDLRFRSTEITPEVRDEMDVIAATAIVNGNYMKAPNGADTNLTPEQWAMVRTKNFREWFGDWENDPGNASKVVDENGEPMVVYHGTAGIINEFEDQQRSPGFWFVDREDVANGYAESASVEFGEEKNVIPVFLNIRNPRVEDAHGEYPAEFALKSYVENDNGVYQEFDTHEEAETYRKENAPDGWVGASEVGDQHDLVERARELGNDGVIMKDMHDQAMYAQTRIKGTQTNYVVFAPSQIKSATGNTGEFSEGEGDIRFSIRTKPAPKKTGKGYKVFYLKDGKLYPPMVANLGGVDTPVGVWLDAEEGTRAGESKTGRPQVKQGGKGTQGGSGKLAYRPGWHLGEIPYALQFNRKDESGEKTLFPADFVWAEVEYANDVDYQEEAMSYGYNANGKFQHSLAGLPKLPTDGSYRYRTNPNPETDPWIITGAMKVNRLLTPSEVDQMVIDAGREPQKRQEGAVTDAQIEALNKELGLQETVSFRFNSSTADEIDIKAMRGISTLRAFNVSFSEMRKIFYDVAEETEKAIMQLRAKQNRTAYENEKLAREEKELRAIHRRIDWWESVNSQLVSTDTEPTILKDGDFDLEPRTPAEFISKFLTMSMTRVNKQFIDKEGKAGIKKVNKRAGVMLTQDTLRRELGWNEKDWSGFRYILSESEGKSLDEIAEMISEDSDAQSIFVGMDVMDIKNEIIDFLQSVRSYADIRDYIKNERIREAKEERDYLDGLVEATIEQIESSTGMTIDEYNDRIITEELKDIEKILRDVETSEIYGKFEDLTDQKNEAYQRSLLEGAEGGIQEGDQAVPDLGDGAMDSAAAENSEPQGDSRGADTGDVGDRADESGGSRIPPIGNKRKGLVQEPMELSSESASVDEVVNKGRQKAINENVQANDIFSEKVQRLNNSLAKLRSALAAQREYDVNTVKIITALANELLQIGRLPDMSRSEIKRLLSVIKDATGKEDLSIAVERLMDIMIANQLRSGKSKISELTKIKASKVNASGVEVRGFLDVAGQQMLQTFKDSIAPTMTDETLAENISIEESNLDSDSDVIRKNAENRLAGYYLAQQYRENILASEAEEKSIREEIKRAKEQHDAGLMDKDAFKEFVKSCYDAIRENRMERVTAYEKLANQLAAKLAGSILNAKLLKDAEKARIEQIHHFANSDMQGMPSVQQGEVKKGIWNNTILRFLFKPLATFDQMLRSFAPKSRNGEGYLWNHFMGGWLRSSENEFKGIQAAHEQLDAKVRSMFAGVKRWSDLFSIEKKLPTMEVKFWDGEKMADFTLTQGNLLYIYMVNKMTDGKMKLRKMGITEEDVNNIARELDPRFIELADWIQDTFLPGLREKYNTLHEKMFGAPMAAIDNYFPIRVLANARTREVDIAVEESSARPSTITGSIIKRTKNSLALDILGSDAFDVVLEHIEQMEHWAAFAEFNRDLNTLLSYRKFRNRVQNMRGIYGAGTTAWNNFRSVAEIAAGVYKPAVKGDSLDKLITNLAKGVTGAKISFRVYTALKQFLSAPAFVSDASAAALIKSLANPYKAWTWAMKELPLFEKRWKSRQAGDSRLMETESDWKLWKNKIVELAGRYGMTPNAFVDALTVSIGARAIYETKRKEYVKLGYTQDQAEEKAKRDATVLYNESQQSNESAFLSAAQVDRTVASVLITVFRNSSMGYQRMYVDALRNIKHMLKKGYKAESLEYMKKQMMRDGLTEDQAERAANRIYNKSFARSATRLATFGFLVQFAWNLGPYMAYLLMGDDDDEKKDMIKDAAVRGLVGGPVEGLAAGQAISGVLGDFAMGEEISDPMLKLPATSDMESIFRQLEVDPVRAVNDIFNLVIQSGIGVNPQTITDAVVAIIDGCNGDLETSKEAAFALMRILQTPQSQIEKLYMEEIDFTAEEALDMSVREFAERYAKYKVMRTAPLAKWVYSDEKEKELEDKYIKTFTKKASEMERTHGTEEAQEFFKYYDSEYEETAETLRDLKKQLKEAILDSDTEREAKANEDLDNFLESEEFKRFEELLPHIKAYEAYRKALKTIDDPKMRSEYAEKMIQERNAAVEILRGE